jgi:hypothetical protein
VSLFKLLVADIEGGSILCFTGTRGENKGLEDKEGDFGKSLSVTVHPLQAHHFRTVID